MIIFPSSHIASITANNNSLHLRHGNALKAANTRQSTHAGESAHAGETTHAVAHRGLHVAGDENVRAILFAIPASSAKACWGLWMRLHAACEDKLLPFLSQGRTCARKRGTRISGEEGGDVIPCLGSDGIVLKHELL